MCLQWMLHKTLMSEMYLYNVTIMYYTIQMDAGCQKSRMKWKKSKRVGGQGQKIGNFDDTYFFESPLVGLPFLMVADGDCGSESNGIE